jgi:hypothetical protein
MIHPGSVMFKRGDGGASPRYIVAGEIIRISRMYAMSVSPLSLEILQRISPLLLSELADLPGQADLSGEPQWGEDRTKTERGKLRRDFTNNIKLGNEIFSIETIKGKKHVFLPWEKLSSLKDSGIEAIDPGQYRGLRGIITIRDHTLLAGEKLSLILTLLPTLEPEGAFDREWKRKIHFFSGETESLTRLAGELSNVLLPVVHGKKQTPKGKPRTEKHGRELGFIALYTNDQGVYWFRCSRGFYTALNESMASLEALIDELGDEVDLTVKHEVNQTFRRLSDILGA